MIDDKYFSAYPAGNKALLLSEEYRILMIKNLLGCLQGIQNKLNIDIHFLHSKYQRLDVKRSFSPTIFNSFYKLVNSIKVGNVPEIIDALHQLKVLSEADIYNSQFAFSTILCECWETDFVNKLRSNHIPNKSNENTLLLPIITSDLSDQKLIYRNLCKQIERVDFDFFQELNTYVTRVKLFNGKALKAATSASVFGAIYLKLPPITEYAYAYYADHIIHETSHLQLDILLAFDKIVLNEDSEKFKAPIRIDPRPMLGIFHATFVLSRMIRIFQRIILEQSHPVFVKKLDGYRQQFNQGIEVIEKYGILTNKGKLIFDSFVPASEI